MGKGANRENVVIRLILINNIDFRAIYAGKKN